MRRKWVKNGRKNRGKQERGSCIPCAAFPVQSSAKLIKNRIQNSNLVHSRMQRRPKVCSRHREGHLGNERGSMFKNAKSGASRAPNMQIQNKSNQTRRAEVTKRQQHQRLADHSGQLPEGRGLRGLT